MRLRTTALALAGVLAALAPPSPAGDPGTTYCTAHPFFDVGCLSTLSGSGTPSASAASGFDVIVTGTKGMNVGILFYGYSGPADLPWNGGATLCVTPPVRRTLIKFTFGTFQTCDGTFSHDFNAINATGYQVPAGTTVNVQGWFRDPFDPGWKSAYSDGYEFTYGP